MQVLVKNPYISSLNSISGTSPSFWSPECMVPNDNFSVAETLRLSGDVGLSPFLFLDWRMAFMICELQSGRVFSNLGPFGTIAINFLKGSKIIPPEFTNPRYLDEYIPTNKQDIFEDASEYDQVLVYDETEINQELWEKLKVGGEYLLGNEKSPLKIDLPVEEFDARGKLWPIGEATEWGWRFRDFEFARLKKLR